MAEETTFTVQMIKDAMGKIPKYYCKEKEYVIPIHPEMLKYAILSKMVTWDEKRGGYVIKG